MTDVHDAVALVEADPAFAAFIAAHPDAYLAHVFCHVKGMAPPLEIGYYSPQGDHVTVFTVEPVAARPPEQAFKEDGPIARLDLARVAVGFAEVRAIVAVTCGTRYPAHPVQQEICVLQQHDGLVWNITLITVTFHVLRLRVDASSGEVVFEELRTLLDFRS